MEASSCTNPLSKISDDGQVCVMFRGKNSANKKDLFNSPDKPDHSEQDSDAYGWTRLRRSCGWMRRSELCVRETSLSFIKITHLLRLVARYAWMWVWKGGPHMFLGILWMLRVSEVWKINFTKFYSSFMSTIPPFLSWVWVPRIVVLKLNSS